MWIHVVIKRDFYIPLAGSITAANVFLHKSTKYPTSCPTYYKRGCSVSYALRIVNLFLQRGPKEKFQGVRCGDRRDQKVEPAWPNHCLRNCLFQNVFTLPWIYGGVPSYWRTTFGLLLNSYDINHTTYISGYINSSNFFSA